MVKRKSVAPFYAVAALWLVWSFVLPLYAVWHYIAAAAVSAVVFAAVSMLCRGTLDTVETEAKPEPVSSGNEELDQMLENGRKAIAELKRLDANIADETISAEIVRMEQVSTQIFEQVRQHPEQLSKIRRFMDYYLPTTLKLLNAYDRASATGISGENIDNTKRRVEDLMHKIVAAFEKQLDALFAGEAMDVSTDIQVMEDLLAQEGWNQSAEDDFGLRL